MISDRNSSDSSSARISTTATVLPSGENWGSANRTICTRSRGVAVRAAPHAGISDNNAKAMIPPAARMLRNSWFTLLLVANAVFDDDKSVFQHRPMIANLELADRADAISMQAQWRPHAPRLGSRPKVRLAPPPRQKRRKAAAPSKRH